MWENGDDVTLITRPRRFGKTLNMSMLECFFSNRYADRGDLFEGLITRTGYIVYQKFASQTSNGSALAEPIFSDLNNLRVVTTTSDLYADYFGFTEKEVFDSLDIGIRYGLLIWRH